ncbi:right-handed parallel beta-helix repeat-containing protein [Luteimonas saliphila]|uniref:right-handed parallel beta-helix repeat-containing protein n=1 Tax=Luteimonas saliphila TaxID=2804919 RepID=UPI00192E0B65|nr:right-handed parallel beta-helix repeat-containing protein [Luteimonas saliphila]
MPTILPCWAPLLLSCVLAGASTGARAEASATCTGFVDSVPATISAPGVWCLRRDLSTAISEGAAITIAADGVALHCNDFKLGGLAAGPSSRATGIRASSRRNTVVRRCTVRGFLIGINLDNGGEHVVEDNRLDDNLYGGIRVNGERNVVRRNRVHDTGGGTGQASGYGLFVGDAEVVDNVVSGVFAVQPDASTTGITLFGGRATGNRVRGLAASGTGSAIGILANVAGRISGNQVVSDGSTSGTGILATSGGDAQCRDNLVGGFATPIANCADIGGNSSF